MATVTKRGDTYQISVSCGYDINGKQIRRTKTWRPKEKLTEKQLKKELEKQKVLFEQEVENGTVANKDVKFAQLAEEWFTQTKLENTMKPLSLKRLQDCKDRTYQAIGHLYISKLSKRQIQMFINNLSEDGVNKHTGKGLSSSSQSIYLNFISNICNYAIDCGIINMNPCHGVHLIKTEKKERRIYTLEEAQQFITALYQLPEDEMKYKLFYLLAIYGGFRRGELLGFEWKDIDFDNNIISVHRTSLQDRNNGGVYTEEPKTKTSKRSLKLPVEIIKELKIFKIYQAEQRLRLGDQWIDTDRIFTTWNGKPMGVETAGSWLRKFCKRKDLPVVNIHSFRHLNASLLITNGIDAKTVSKVLGHAQTSTTLNIYAHTFAEAEAKALETVADSINLGQIRKSG